jgi:membrane protein required for colicin V production
MSLAFQFLDVVVVLAIIVSTVYGTMRGFVSESLSIIAWLLAALAMLYFGPWVGIRMAHAMEPRWLGLIVGYVAVFLVVVIPLSFMTVRLSQNVKKSQIGPLDRSLGAAFGIVRGLAAVGIAYLAFTTILPVAHQPDWVARARLLPVIKGSAEVIDSLVPEQNIDWGTGASHEKRAENPPPESKVTPAETRKTEPAPAPKAAKPAKKKAAVKPAKKSKKTYGAQDRKALDKLIENNGKGNDGKP